MKVLVFIILLYLSTNLSAQKVGYEKSIELSASFPSGVIKNNTYSFSTVQGYRFSKRLCAGMGLGFGWNRCTTGIDHQDENIEDIYSFESYLIPVFAQIKFNFTKDKITPFALINLGYIFFLEESMVFNNNFFVEPCVGIEMYLRSNNKMSRKYDYSTPSIYITGGVLMQNHDYAYVQAIEKAISNQMDVLRDKSALRLSLKIGFKF